MGKMNRLGLLGLRRLRFDGGCLVRLAKQINLLRLLIVIDGKLNVLRSCSRDILDFAQVFKDGLLKFLERHLC